MTCANYFQNICIDSIIKDKATHVEVLAVRLSPVNIQVRNVNDIIPIAKPMSLADHKAPP